MKLLFSLILCATCTTIEPTTITTAAVGQMSLLPTSEGTKASGNRPFKKRILNWPQSDSNVNEVDAARVPQPASGTSPEDSTPMMTSTLTAAQPNNKASNPMVPYSAIFIDAFWRNFVVLVKKGSTWQQAMFGSAMPPQNLNANYVNLMNDVALKVKWGDSPLNAICFTILKGRYLPVESLRELDITRDPKRLKQVQEKIDGDPVFAHIPDITAKIMQEIRKGATWFMATSKVLLNNPPLRNMND